MNVCALCNEQVTYIAVHWFGHGFGKSTMLLPGMEELACLLDIDANKLGINDMI